MAHPARTDVGFDSERYIKHQARMIRSVVLRAPERLYLEFGGKIINDKHAARVLPGYREDSKLELLKDLLPAAEIIFVVSGRDILRKRVRGDYGITYDKETVRAITELRNNGLTIKNVAISLLESSQPIPEEIKAFRRKLIHLGLQPHLFFAIKNYPSKRLNVGALQLNPYIPMRKQLVLILSPGGGSGKFGVCLNRLYHEMLRGAAPRYLKFETFPVHDLPIRHPLNLAYMAASADFYDEVMKDKKHGRASSYKRDIENYNILHLIASMFLREGKHLRRLTSATHMGINMLTSGIVNHEIVEKEAAAEIARRLIRYKHEVKAGKEDRAVLERVRTILRML